MYRLRKTTRKEHSPTGVVSFSLFDISVAAGPRRQHWAESRRRVQAVEI
jgi:hypothetical protein